MKAYIGGDPGKGGGVAVITSIGNGVAYKWPDSPAGVAALFKQLTDKYDIVFGAVESVHSMPGQGVVSTFTFGKGYGQMLQAFASAGIPFVDVRPQAWMKDLGIPPRKRCDELKPGQKKKDWMESPTQWKNRLKGLAQQYFPGEKITLATSDAFLIALWAHRMGAPKDD
tara:strand:+ start:64 stop:570 length:507 start_codon:yes stop_codon:yes gene_type:complete